MHDLFAAVLSLLFAAACATFPSIPGRFEPPCNQRLVMSKVKIAGKVVYWSKEAYYNLDRAKAVCAIVPGGELIQAKPADINAAMPQLIQAGMYHYDWHWLGWTRPSAGAKFQYSNGQDVDLKGFKVKDDIASELCSRYLPKDLTFASDKCKRCVPVDCKELDVPAIALCWV